MVWKRLIGRGSVVLFTYLVVNTLVIVTNPAKFVTQTTDFLGEPVGDLSDEVRLYLAEKTGGGLISTNVTWETDAGICFISWNWNIPGGNIGYFLILENNMCNHMYSVDYYSVEGINTLSPVGMEVACHEYGYMNGFRTYKFCDEDTGEPEMIRHIFDFELDNITETLVLLEGSRSSDVEVLFYSMRQAGIYLAEDPTFICNEPAGISVGYELWAGFWGEVAVEVKNATVGVRSAILAELSDLVSNERLPDSLSAVGMKAGICEAIGASDQLMDCSIGCTATYPYSSSVCIGSYELRLVKDIPHKTFVISVMVVTVVVSWLTLSTLRLGMRDAHGRSRRGYLGPGGTCQYLFEEEGEDGDCLSLANPLPSMQSVKVSPQGTTLPTPFRSGSRYPRRQAHEEPAGFGIVVCAGVQTIPINVLAPTCTPFPVDSPRRKVSLGSAGGSETLPICFVVRENVDSSVENLDELYHLLDKDARLALLDESFGGDHVAWVRGFSLVDAVRCLLTLWTVHFVAAMEVFYDLAIPRVEVLGLIVTVVWTLLVVVLCGHFVFVLGYEPVYYGGGGYSTKVSLATALSVGTALRVPFALAGDWIRGSRCGDLGGRLAISFCLGRPNTPNGSRVCHVNRRSELYPA